jgi:hypothetical protein
MSKKVFKPTDKNLIEDTLDDGDDVLFEIDH